MQRNTRFLWLATALLVLTGGCISSGREQSNRGGGPSPSFGLNSVPQQSEPPVENVADDGKLKSRPVVARAPATADLDSVPGNPAGNKGNKLVNWMASREKEPAPRKPLPLAPGSTVAADADQVEP